MVKRYKANSVLFPEFHEHEEGTHIEYKDYAALLEVAGRMRECMTHSPRCCKYRMLNPGKELTCTCSIGEIAKAFDALKGGE